MRAGKKTNNEVSIEEPIGLDKEGNHITYNDILSNENDEVLEEVDLKILIHKMYAAIEGSLSKRENDVLKLRYGLIDGKEWTQNQVAEKYGISRSYVYDHAYCKRYKRGEATPLLCFLCAKTPQIGNL